MHTIKTAPGHVDARVPLCFRSWGLPAISVMRCAIVLLPILALVACAAPAGVTPSAEPKVRAERPTYTLGEKWIRSDGVYELVRMEDDLYIFISEYGREIHLTKELALARIGRPGDFQWEFDPPPRLT